MCYFLNRICFKLGLIVLVFVVAAYSSCVEECPTNEEGALLPNTCDCTSFYQCVGGQPILHHCPEGLEWNVAAKLCDWPEIANCKETEN